MLLGILFGPAALLELGKDMTLAISSLLMSCRNIVLPFSIARLSEKCLLNNIKKNEKLYKNFLIYYIGYLTPNCVKLLYLSIDMKNWYIEENNENH